MKSIASIVIGALLSSCQVHRVSAVRVESEYGDPVRGAKVGMFSMQSGHPLYPDLVTDAEGLTPIIPGLNVNREFIFNVEIANNKYVFDSENRRHNEGNVVVLRLEEEYKIEGWSFRDTSGFSTKTNKTKNPNKSAHATPRKPSDQFWARVPATHGL